MLALDISILFLTYTIESTYLVPHFDDTYRFIKEAKDQNGCVLVHCKMGMSRSASSVVAYLMKEYKMVNDQALEHVRKARPIVQPNDSFAKQLVEYNGILQAKIEYQNSLSRSPDTKPPPLYDRKKSALEKCSTVDVKKIAGSRFSYPDGPGHEEEVLFRDRKNSLKSKK